MAITHSPFQTQSGTFLKVVWVPLVNAHWFVIKKPHRHIDKHLPGWQMDEYSGKDAVIRKTRCGLGEGHLSLQCACSLQTVNPLPVSSHSNTPGVSVWVGGSLKSELNQALTFPCLFKWGPGEHSLVGSVTSETMKWISSSNVQSVNNQWKRDPDGPLVKHSGD